MKTYKEMAECVFKRSKEQIVKQKKRRRKICLAAGLSCICLLGICGIYLFEDGDARQIKLMVNDFPHDYNDMDVKLDALSENYDRSSETWNDVITDFETFTGINYKEFLAKIPEEFRENYTLYSLLARHRNGERLDDYELHDYVFDFTLDDDASITIALCPYEAPLRDYFIETKNPKVSDIYGTSATIYGFDQFYIVESIYQDVYLDIETRGLDLDQLTELLASLFKS